jgi:uncharacterized spore protein YtfJ
MKGSNIMSINVNVNENINLLFERLESFIKSKTIFGESIQVGDATLIPVVNVSFGLGSGGGDGSDSKGNGGVGGGAGIGAKASPTAIIVIKGDNIEVLPIKKSSGLEKLIDMVPGIVEKVKAETEKKQETEEKEE